MLFVMNSLNAECSLLLRDIHPVLLLSNACLNYCQPVRSLRSISNPPYKSKTKYMIMECIKSSNNEVTKAMRTHFGESISMGDLLAVNMFKSLENHLLGKVV